MGDRKQPTPPPPGAVKPAPPPAPPAKRIDLRDGKPSYGELDAMYWRAVDLIAQQTAEIERLKSATPPAPLPRSEREQERWILRLRELRKIVGLAIEGDDWVNWFCEEHDRIIAEHLGEAIPPESLSPTPLSAQPTKQETNMRVIVHEQADGVQTERMMCEKHVGCGWQSGYGCPEDCLGPGTAWPPAPLSAQEPETIHRPQPIESSALDRSQPTRADSRR